VTKPFHFGRNKGKEVRMRAQGFQVFHGLALAACAAGVPAAAQTAINITGTVTDSAGTVMVSGASCKLEVAGNTATSAADGKFVLTGSSTLLAPPEGTTFAELRDGSLRLQVASASAISVTPFGGDGRAFATLHRRVEAGTHSVPLADLGSGARWVRVKAGVNESILRLLAVDGDLAGMGDQAFQPRQAMAKASDAALYDYLVCTKAGYQKAYVTISRSDTADVRVKMLKENPTKFSFFVTSMRTLQDMAGPNGFGGDFRYGETGPGAGLRGADKICAAIAERSMPGSSVKGWRAFLSVSSDTYGKQVNAISRVGAGPWYDRVGRLLAPTVADLPKVRPTNGDPTIQLDLPNEWGIPNHRPDPTKPQEDNHHMVTGSTATGTLKGTGMSATCQDWTTKVHSTANGRPSCGFAWPRGGQVGSSGSNWITSFDPPGCAAGIEITDGGGPSQTANQQGWIGGGGGYGGFYCFALNP
jgi:hypothetical protein